MAQRIAGTAFLKVDGRQYPLHGNFTIGFFPFERTGVVGLDGFHGFNEEPKVEFIEGDISLTSDVSMDTLGAMTNVTVTAELANGNDYVLIEAYTKGAFELNAGEGTVRIRWEGKREREVLG